jgi:DNA-directed RNA polymerase specialized sigma24 family protein
VLPPSPLDGPIGEDHVVVSSWTEREWAHVADAPHDAIAAPLVADFDTFVAENFEKVRRWIGVVLNRDDPTQAEDIAQEAFLRTYMRWARVSAMDKPAGYVARIAWNLALAWLRRRERATAPDVLMSEPGGSSPDEVVGRIDRARSSAENTSLVATGAPSPEDQTRTENTYPTWTLTRSKTGQSSPTRPAVTCP